MPTLINPGPTPVPSTRPFDDFEQTRERIYGRVREAYVRRYPLENAQYRLELTNVDYDPQPKFDFAAQRRAIIRGQTLRRPLLGDWRLVDKVSRQTVDERKRARVAMVPHLTERGTFIINGVEWSLANQLRLKPGVYTRRRETGELESHFNVRPGTGSSFRVYLEPETGRFRVKVGQAVLPLYPLMRVLGHDDKQLESWWGRDLLQANADGDYQKQLPRFRDKFAAPVRGEKAEQDPAAAVRAALERAELDPQVTTATLGEPHRHVSAEALALATQKLLAVSRGLADTDDRDNLAYQTILGPEDLLAERVERDAGGTARNLLWRATWRRNLDPVVNTDARARQLQGAIMDSGLGQPMEETNPLDGFDQAMRISRMGAGGIPDVDSIPDESRTVQPSYLAYIDPVRTSESEKAGVDNRLAYLAEKGDDGSLYARLKTRSGEPRLVAAADLARATVAFPGELAAAPREDRLVRAMSRGQLRLVRPEEVDYELSSAEQMLSPHAQLVPFVSAVRGHRALMGAKMINQALALREPEAPLVQAARDNPQDAEDTFEKFLGLQAGVVRARTPGVVRRVTDEEIVVRSAAGETQRIPLYRYFPFNRRSFITNTPRVTAGQAVVPGDLLATSNFSDADGRLALGANFRIGLLPYKGLTYEDAIVVSESAAKRLTSEHMHQHDVDLEPGQRISKASFLAKYPTVYPQALIDKFDDDGIIRSGETVRPGEPLVLSITKLPPKGQGILHRLGRDRWVNSSTLWEQPVEGLVVDAHRGPRTANVVVRSYQAAQIGDKLANRMGSKGVISAIIPDERMPRDQEDRPLEVLMHPFVIVSRTNPNFLLEAALGKAAEKRGRPYRVPGFSDGNYVDFVRGELKKYGLSDTEDLYDPEREAKIPKVFVGRTFLMKLHHLAENKLGARGEDEGYTADMLPSRAAEAASKRLGQMETAALLSAGAVNVLRDAKLLRGQRNDDFWRAFRLGYPPPTPQVPFVYRKFFDQLRAAGINVQRSGNYVNIMALTDKDVTALSRGPIRRAETLDFDSMDPVAGGLFDLGRTGGHGGAGWAHIDLEEPLPNPVMEEPIRRLLDLTGKQFREVLGGQRELGGATGGEAVRRALAAIDVPRAIADQETVLARGPRSRRDAAIKKLRYLHMFRKTGIKPEELVLTKLPVLPPQYRPIVKTSRMTLVSHPNALYRDIMLSNENLRDVKEELGPAGAGAERLALYDSFSALTGMTDPVPTKLRQSGVRGILAHALGLRASPKFSDFQRRVLSTQTDLVGRGVIIPDPTLNMDQVGLPEKAAWELYRPFVMRRLVRLGTPAVLAARMIENRDPQAEEQLRKEMADRPVVVNRAPTLHRYGIMAAFPILTKDKVLRVSPITTGGFGADFDGDAEQFHVPVSDAAVREAIEKLLPSRNLLQVKDFQVHYLPAQEFLHGLYEASTQRSDLPPRVFRSRADAVRAYRQGKIGLGDRVRIEERA